MRSEVKQGDPVFKVSRCSGRLNNPGGLTTSVSAYREEGRPRGAQLQLRRWQERELMDDRRIRRDSLPSEGVPSPLIPWPGWKWRRVPSVRVTSLSTADWCSSKSTKPRTRRVSRYHAISTDGTSTGRPSIASPRSARSVLR